MTKVAVALSGGVDSAVVAALLLERGYDVVGVTGKMTCSDESEQVVANAKKVANKLGIKHYVLDVSNCFKEKVIDYFENSYKVGKTPNPCIMCNKYIKWGAIFDYVTNELDADYIATGHYANIQEEKGIYKLLPASDEHKDQLYFLFLLSQDKLAKTIFPLCKYTKTQVREFAEKYDLPPKSAKESQDICFVKPPMTTKKYLNSIIENNRGCFVEKTTGKIVGYHNGAWQYTIGQRKGIGIAAPFPLYVLEIDTLTNTVYVGYKEELKVENLELQNVYWSYPVGKDKFEALVKIRYNMQAVRAEISIAENLKVKFLEPVYGAASGQACVFYDLQDGHLLGGGFI